MGLKHLLLGNMSIEKRKGRIEIHRDFIRPLEPQKEFLHLLFSKFIPIYIDRDGFNDSFIYLGYCDEFEETTDVEPIKQYDAIFTEANGTFTLEFKKRCVF